MDVNKIPIIGKINKNMLVLSVNFFLLGVVSLILGIVIPFYPEVLDVLASALLIVAAIVLFNIAYHVHASRKRYFEWLEDK